MPRAKKKKKKLSIYLAKNDHASDIEFVKVENSIAPKTVKLPTGSATLYIKKEVDPHPPNGQVSFARIKNSHQKFLDREIPSARY